jgi:GNAT superfamily N-acetyltransferase
MHSQLEMLTPLLQDEVHELVRGYYDVTKAHEGIPDYQFRWPVYDALQQQDMLRLITVRDDRNKLVGFALYIVMEHLHHEGWRVAECDSLSVAHTHRGQGLGKLMLELAEIVLAEDNVKLMLNRYRTCYGAEGGELFKRAGFECIEHVYAKPLNGGI